VIEPDGRGRDDFRFDGLENLNGFMFPDALLDRVMANLTGAEFKVLAYIVRRTLGFKKESDTISLEQICSGVRLPDGMPLDAGTGLSKKTAIAALKGLEDKGVIIARKRMSREKGNLPTAFAVRFKEQAGAEAPALGYTLAPLPAAREQAAGPTA
jgi:hypothetical protein